MWKIPGFVIAESVGVIEHMILSPGKIIGLIFLVPTLFKLTRPFHLKKSNAIFNIPKLQSKQSDLGKSSWNPSFQWDKLGAIFVATATGILLSMNPANALTFPLNSEFYHLSPISIQSDDFWYPPFMIGKWKTDFSFKGATFNSVLPLEDLATKGDLPGFSKYSVLFIPDMGMDVKNVILRYVQLDSHPREDHPHNIRNLVSAMIPDAVVDAAPYSFQKAPDWFHSPANKWTIKYHDDKGRGEVNLLTRKRNIEVFAGAWESIEYIEQVQCHLIQ